MIEITINQNDLLNIKKKLGDIDPRQEGRLFKTFARLLSIEGEAVLKEEVLSGQALKRLTGHLAQSIGSRDSTFGGDPVIVLGSGVRIGGMARVPYANIHETGGIIRPKNGKYLTIPIRAGSAGAIKLGMWNYTKGKRKGQAKPPKAFSANIVGFRKVKQVKIPASHYLTKGAKILQKKASELFSMAFKQVVG